MDWLLGLSEDDLPCLIELNLPRYDEQPATMILVLGLTGINIAGNLSQAQSQPQLGLPKIISLL